MWQAAPPLQNRGFSRCLKNAIFTQIVIFDIGEIFGHFGTVSSSFSMGTVYWHTNSNMEILKIMLTAFDLPCGKPAEMDASSNSRRGALHNDLSNCTYLPVV